jgi:DNA-binding MarR family transcriptional regulator
MEGSSQLTPEETRVYEVIKRETKSSGGIKQSQIKKHPELRDIDPRKITEIVKKLKKLNLVKRKLINEGGKRCYLLVAEGEEKMQQSIVTEPSNTSSSTEIVTTTPVTFTSPSLDIEILDIPCMRCKHVFGCGIGRTYDPLHCPLITQFILEGSGTIPKS